MDKRNAKWLALAEQGYVIELGFHTVAQQVDPKVWGPTQTHHDRPTMGTRPHVPQRGLHLMRRQLWRTWLWVDAAGKPARWDVIGSNYEMKPQQIFNIALDTE